MMKEAIASFRKWSEDGFTLIELMIVLMVLTTLTALAIPALNKIVEDAKVKRYVAEAEMVCAAFTLYVAERGLDQQIDVLDINEEINMGYPLGHSRHPLTSRIEYCTKGARIAGMVLKNNSMSSHGIVYYVDGYRIDVFPADGEPIVSKIEF